MASWSFVRRERNDRPQGDLPKNECIEEDDTAQHSYSTSSHAEKRDINEGISQRGALRGKAKCVLRQPRTSDVCCFRLQLEAFLAMRSSNRQQSGE
jgi:hypothetical protein